MNRELKNIITINDFNYSQGGASKVAIDTANIFAEKGYNSIFISAVCDDEKSILSSKVKQYRYNGKEFLQYNNKVKGMLEGIRNEGFSKFVNDVLNQYSPYETIVHVHGWTKACSSHFFKILKERNYITFLTLHEYFSFCPNGAYYNYKTHKACDYKGCSIRCVTANCDSRNFIFKIYRVLRELSYKKNMDFRFVEAIFISEFEKKIISKQIAIYNSCIIENPVENVKLQCVHEEFDHKEFDYIYIGRTTKEKGIDLFLELAKEFPNKKFLLVGDLQQAHPNNIVITGWVSEQRVDQYLQRSNILIFPSLWPETFGLNVMKALEMGMECIVSSNTAAAEYVERVERGHVFKQGDINSLIEVCRKIDEGSNMPLRGKHIMFNSEDVYFEELIERYNMALEKI